MLGLAVLTALLALVSSACSKPKSFIVLSLRSADATPITGVTEVVVTVNQLPSLSKVLTYPPKDGKPFTIDQSTVNDLSVSFTGGRNGPVALTIAVKNATGCTIGFRSGISVSIREGDIASSAVDLLAEDCVVPTDGGVDAGADAFPGCDPVTPAPVCTTTPVQTCQVNCTTRKGECTKGGTGGNGASCLKNENCAPGFQCFDYSNTAGTGSCAGVKICLRFCNDDNGCKAPVADGGVTGTTSVCQGLVPCPLPDGGTIFTAYHTCTFACDPRQAAAAAGTTGCPAGLSCLVVGNMDQVDCSCAGATRKGVDGDACSGGADCAPGFICNEMAQVKKCRSICRCDAQGLSCTSTKNDCGAKTCSALTNDTTFGVCL